jgi:TPM domain
MFKRWARILRHQCFDARHLHAAIPAALLDRLMARVRASEARHSGEIRVCVEGRLPLSYLLRDGTARQRAVAMFSKLRVWDTEHNNGVLIYLLLLERSIEVVADRGLARRVPQPAWDAMVRRMSEAFKAGDFEHGLTEAVAEVSALLVQHFPLEPGQQRPNEIQDRPTLI